MRERARLRVDGELGELHGLVQISAGLAQRVRRTLRMDHRREQGVHARVAGGGLFPPTVALRDLRSCEAPCVLLLLGRRLDRVKLLAHGRVLSVLEHQSKTIRGAHHVVSLERIVGGAQEHIHAALLLLLFGLGEHPLHRVLGRHRRSRRSRYDDRGAREQWPRRRR